MTVPIAIPLVLHGAVIFSYITGVIFLGYMLVNMPYIQHMDAYGLYPNDIKWQCHMSKWHTFAPKTLESHRLKPSFSSPFFATSPPVQENLLSFEALLCWFFSAILSLDTGFLLQDHAWRSRQFSRSLWEDQASGRRGLRLLGCIWIADCCCCWWWCCCCWWWWW